MVLQQPCKTITLNDTVTELSERSAPGRLLKHRDCECRRCLCSEEGPEELTDSEAPSWGPDPVWGVTVEGRHACRGAEGGLLVARGFRLL